MNIMLCGANDVAQILPFFYEVSTELEFQALNFIKGDILYHNYGVDKWVKNSKLTVHNADILVFIISSKYGQITWNTEFEEALNNGKNFIVLCENEIYQFYRQLIDKKLKLAKSKDNKSASDIYQLIQKLELENQITIIPFTLNEFKKIFKRELLKLFKNGVDLLENENKKNSFLPILLSSKFNDFPKQFINSRSDKLCKDLLFDFFEKKEIRKKAMDYFFISKSLSEDEIIELCLDSEQGVARKAIQNINQLVSSRHNLSSIFNEVIPSIANEEVGTIRRAIVNFIALDIANSIQYFHLFFPSTDVGTPRRIILAFRDRLENLKKLLKKRNDLKVKLIELITLCINYKTETTGWKEQADFLLKEFS